MALPLPRFVMLLWGVFDAWAEAFLGKWDYSAAALIVQEAGGRLPIFAVTDTSWTAIIL